MQGPVASCCELVTTGSLLGLERQIFGLRLNVSDWIIKSVFAEFPIGVSEVHNVNELSGDVLLHDRDARILSIQFSLVTERIDAGVH
jgi:hypothetical protein